MRTPEGKKGLELDNEGKRIKIKLRENAEFYSVVLVYRVEINKKAYIETKTLKGYKLKMTPESRKKDVAKLIEVKRIRDTIEMNAEGKIHNVFEDSSSTDKTKVNFIEYMKTIATRYKGNTYKIWKKAIIHVETFFNSSILITELTKDDCRNYVAHLKTALKPNTASTYFQKFKQTINQAIDDKIIEQDISARISVRKEKPFRDFLSLDEIERLRSFPANNISIKNGFLFSCYTGLRFEDLLNLQYQNVSNDTLDIIMHKTKERLVFKLTRQAIDILEQQRELNRANSKDYVFLFTKHNRQDFPDYQSYYERVHYCSYKSLKTFLKQAGITKKISFHNARHTFATSCQLSKLPDSVTQKLLGHTDIRITQVYLKELQNIKDEAIDTLSDYFK